MVHAFFMRAKVVFLKMIRKAKYCKKDKRQSWRVMLPGNNRAVWNLKFVISLMLEIVSWKLPALALKIMT